MGDMFSFPVQFKLRHLPAAVTAFSAVSWFVAAIILPIAGLGSRHDLPQSEQAVIAALQGAGLNVRDHFT
jgi:hypothetical protein